MDKELKKKTDHVPSTTGNNAPRPSWLLWGSCSGDVRRPGQPSSGADLDAVLGLCDESRRGFRTAGGEFGAGPSPVGGSYFPK